MTTVGQAGSPIGIPAQAVTIATALKSMGYATGQFGKNHLGDLNEFLPTVHGFDEFFGYLYHLDAMEDPAHPNYPQDLLATVGPRNMVHSWATTTDDPTVMPRWGKIGKQRIEDAGTLYPKRMETWTTRSATCPSNLSRRRRQECLLPALNPMNAHRHPPCAQIPGNYATRRTAGRSTRPAWRSWMTTSVWDGSSRTWAPTTTPSSLHHRQRTENFTWPDGGRHRSLRG
jgi:arylsulfatase